VTDISFCASHNTFEQTLLLDQKRPDKSIASPPQASPVKTGKTAKPTSAQRKDIKAKVLHA
jgi:hypothetical protein